ncbi:MAG TPA: histidine--tRNA ligase, partial [Methylophilaceae bacterium]|nr:histidine--tRNA ligase [Methylophilaceae bacterium]
IGVEAFGYAGPDVAAEQIIMLARLWRELGITDVELQINTIGDIEERAEYRKSLIAYFSSHEALLDEDAKRRLHTNPLRILDSKNSRMQAMIEGAPKLIDHLGEATRAHFDGLRRLLDLANVPYRINPRLVRGLDYYNRSVFEWVTTKLGSQGTIAAGGRYDTLVQNLGGEATPACGFAMGLERICLLMQEYGVQASDAPDVYLVNVGEAAELQALSVAEKLRNADIAVALHAGGGSFKSQMKKADRSAAAHAIILGEDEVRSGEVTLKPMTGGEQARMKLEEAIRNLQAYRERTAEH